MKPNEVEIPILTAGDYGEAGRWSVATLASIARRYDPARFAAPLVLGHPTHDAPAHGWVKSLKVVGDRLVAAVGELSDEVIGWVRRGGYRKVSAAFLPKDDSGVPQLKHVGLLGAAAPRDRALPQVAFSEASPLVIFSTDAPAPPAADSLFLRALGLLLRWLDRALGVPALPPGETPTDSGGGEEPHAQPAEFAAPSPVAPASKAGENPSVTDEEIERFLAEETGAGRLPPLFARSGGGLFLKALARPSAPALFALDATPSPDGDFRSPCRWFMETVRRFPVGVFFVEAAPAEPTAPEGPADRLYRRAYDRLDDRQGLRRRGIALDLFKRVYTPEDCRLILAGAAEGNRPTL